MNFTEKILANGFERVVTDLEKNKGRYDLSFNPQNGWLGVVIYHPVEHFIKGDKKVTLSLERFNVTDMYCYMDKVTKKEVRETNKINERHIIISISNEIVYKNEYGVLPPNEIMGKLLN